MSWIDRAVDRDLVALRVEDEVVVGDPAAAPAWPAASVAAAPAGSGGAARPAQDRLHPHDELGRRERLRQVVVGAVLEPGDPVDRRAPRRQDEDRRRAGLLVAADGPDDGPPVELGEHQVEDDEGRLVLLDRRERRRPVGRGHDREPVALQVRPDEPDDLRVIVDDEDRPVGQGGGLRGGHRANIIADGTAMR